MESASLKLNENYPMASLSAQRNRETAVLTNALPMDPWFTAPITNSVAQLPGFLSPHTTGAYSSYLTTTSSANMNPLPAALGSLASPSCSRNDLELITVTGSGIAAIAGAKIEDTGDPRSSSIVSLRMKAMEHMECLAGTLARGLHGQ